MEKGFGGIQQRNLGLAKRNLFKMNLLRLSCYLVYIQIDNEDVNLAASNLENDNTLTINKDFSEIHIKGKQ